MHEIIRSGSGPFSLAMDNRRRTISAISADDGSKTGEREVYDGVLRIERWIRERAAATAETRGGAIII
jgi:hypothetical protein